MEQIPQLTSTAPLIIKCPVCGACGSMLHHDMRSSLVYSCLNCTHEWQIDPAVGAAAAEPTVIGHQRTRARTKRSRAHKV